MKRKSILPKTLIFAGILLFVFPAIVYSCHGPCWPSGAGACGGFSVGQNTCVGSGPDCEGSCPLYCASGASHRDCYALYGLCTPRSGTCNPIIKYTCRTVAGGGCFCDESGQAGSCWRQVCWFYLQNTDILS